MDKVGCDAEDKRKGEMESLKQLCASYTMQCLKIRITLPKLQHQ